MYPNAEQQRALACQFGCSRFVYNYFLRERMNFYAAHKGEAKQGLNYNDTAAMLTALKCQPEYPWLKDVNAQALQQALKDPDTAYANFFAGRAAFPKFKQRRDKQAFRVPQSFRLAPRLGWLTLPKLEPIKIVVHRPVIGSLKSVTVSRTPAGRYFASILCEIEVDCAPKRHGKERGVDLGLKSFFRHVGGREG